MLRIMYDGSGQMCNKLIFLARVVAFAYEYKESVYYYSFTGFEGIEYQDAELDKYLIKKRPKLNLKFQIKVIVRICNILRIHKVGNCFFIKDKKDAEKYLNAIIQNKAISTKDFCWYGGIFPYNFFTDKNIGILRNYFRFKPYVQKEALDFLKIVPEGKKVCGIHIRRGDYKDWFNGKFYYEDNVYIQLINEIARSFRDFVFIVFSNELINQEIWKNIGLDIVFSQRDAVTELCIMSKCQLLVGPPSTFNAWASFMGNVKRFVITDKDIEFKIEKCKVALIEADGMGNDI